MSQDLYVCSRLTLAAGELEVLHSRSSGPGGQNVNKVNTRVTLRWSPSQCTALPAPWRDRVMTRYRNRMNAAGQLVLHSDRYRDQPRNLADVRQRLAGILLDCQAAPTVRKATRPSRRSQQRRLDAKRKNSQKKQHRRSDIPRD